MNKDENIHKTENVLDYNTTYLLSLPKDPPQLYKKIYHEIIKNIKNQKKKSANSRNLEYL